MKSRARVPWERYVSMIYIWAIEIWVPSPVIIAMIPPVVVKWAVPVPWIPVKWIIEPDVYVTMWPVKGCTKIEALPHVYPIYVIVFYVIVFYIKTGFFDFDRVNLYVNGVSFKNSVRGSYFEIGFKDYFLFSLSKKRKTKKKD